MDPQYKLKITKLSTQDLIPIIQNSKYSKLINFIQQFNITGKDLVELEEFNVILKFGNNVNRKEFQALLNNVKTTPNDLFPLQRNLTPVKRNNSVIPRNELDTILARQQQEHISKQSGLPKPNSLAAVKHKPVLSQNPIQTKRDDIRNEQDSKTSKSTYKQEQYTRRPSFAFENATSTLLAEKVNAQTASLPRPQRNRNNTESLLQHEQRNASHNEIRIEKESKSFVTQNSIQKQSFSVNVQQKRSNWVDQYAKQEQVQERAEHSHQQNQLFRNISNETDVSSAMKDELPEYINIQAHEKFPDPTKQFPRINADEELQEYINIPSTNSQPSNPRVHILDDPVARQELEAKLINALNELKRKPVHQEEPNYSNSNDKPEVREELSVSGTPDSIDSFDRTAPTSPNESSDAPQLPVRPPELIKLGGFRKIKNRDSSGDVQRPLSVDRAAELSSRSPNNKKTIKIENSPSDYEALPSINFRKPIVPVADDNNGYVVPVTLDSPQYVLRRIKFFREVTREKGLQILDNKPVGTFLLRPSKAHLAVLMFLGLRMVNHVPICYDDLTDEYFLKTAPGTVNRDRFKSMLTLLDYYSKYSITDFGEKILSHEQNNIN